LFSVEWAALLTLSVNGESLITVVKSFSIPHQDPEYALMKKALVTASVLSVLLTPTAGRAQPANLCLDGFCIGQSISDRQFDSTDWKIPTKDMTKDQCANVGCQPSNAFRGYTAADQQALADVVSWKYGMMAYTVITNQNLVTLRKYHYECNSSARGIWGQRRFVGFYRSAPSEYITLVGLRLIGGEMRVYRIAREFPYHNQSELVSLANGLHEKYGNAILFYDGISSNAPFEVVKQQKLGWFGRSSMFNPTDLSDNRAEFVLIDPATRPLLEPTSMPDSGEIKPLPVALPSQCSRAMPLK
jgi:hypothetical protein